MVFGILDSILYGASNPYKRWRDSSLENHLRSEGLSEREAGNVAWLINTRAKGEGYGFLIGCVLAWAGTGRFQALRLR